MLSDPFDQPSHTSVSLETSTLGDINHPLDERQLLLQHMSGTFRGRGRCTLHRGFLKRFLRFFLVRFFVLVESRLAQEVQRFAVDDGSALLL